VGCPATETKGSSEDARGRARRRTAGSSSSRGRSSFPRDLLHLHYLLHSPFLPNCRVFALVASCRDCRVFALVASCRAAGTTRPRPADAHCQPPPVAHAPNLGLKWVRFVLRMLPDLYSLAGTSPPTRKSAGQTGGRLILTGHKSLARASTGASDEQHRLPLCGVGAGSVAVSSAAWLRLRTGAGRGH
jgi:hypothetical protein